MNTVKNLKVDYSFMSGLFDGPDGWKSYYFNEAQACFEKHYGLIGKWKINEKDSKKREGHFDENGLWSWTNRINTHPNCCLSFYNWGVKYNPSMFIDFGNPEYHKHNAKQMWKFVDSFFDLIFTTVTTEKYLRELKIKCSKSWNSGNITVIAIIMSLFEAFGEITEIEYTFDFGDGEDMDGIDLKFRLPNGELKTMQIKSGTFLNMGDEFHVNGSQNNLKYSTDYYGYAKADDWKRFTSVIIFENTPNLYKDDKTIIVKKEYEIYNKIQHMPIPEKLNELLVLCGRKDIEFILKKEDGDNSIDYNNESKKITINFIDHEDVEMENLLDNKIKELKELFK
jgi:hypothetical protein